MGVCFFGPTDEPPHRRPRMHNVLPNSGAYGYYLARRARRLGVDVRTPRCATRPLVDGERVNGIECTAANGATERCQARGGVVLACGDYSASAEMKTEYASPELARIDPCCNPANTGDGHRMAITLGGRILNSHMAMPLMRFAPPPRKVWVERLPPWRALTKFMELSLDYMPDRLLRPFIMSFLTTILAVSPRLFEFGAILVNKEGRCFGDELDRPVYRLAAQPDQVAYIVFDSRLAEKFSAFPNYVSTAPGIAYAYVPDYRRSRPDMFSRRRSVAELAHKLGMKPEPLESAIAERNGTLGNPGTSRPMALPIEKPPFFALGPIGAYVKGTDGGLAISERCEVLDQDERRIAGLFAAGLTGQGGMLLEGHGHHLGWAFVSGRIAGRNAAYLANSAAA